MLLAAPVLLGQGATRRDDTSRTVTLEQGRHSTSLRFESAGRLFLCAGSEDLDPGLRVVRRSAAGVPAAVVEDLDSGGGSLACLELELERGEELDVVVFDEAAPSASGARGHASLHASLAVETEESRRQAQEFRAALSSILELEAESAAAEIPFLLELLPERGAELSPRQLAALVELRRLPGRLLTGALAVSTERLAAEYWDRHLPPAHVRSVQAKERLALALKRNGQAADALPLEREVLAQRSLRLPSDHPLVLSARLNLGATHFSVGDLEAAGSEFESVLALLSPDRPALDPLVVAARQNHAAVLLQRGFAGEAAAIYEALLAPLGPDLGGLAYTDVRRNFGQALIEVGETERAESLLSQLFAEQRAALAAEDPELLRTQLHLALALKLLGDVDAARVLEERTLEVQRRTLSDDHPDLLLARLELADTMQLSGDFAGALGILESVVDARARTLPADHPELRTARTALAKCLLETGRLEDARSMLSRIPGIRDVLAGEDVDVLRARELLAVTLRRLGLPDEAQPLQEWALDERERLLPPGHPQVQSARVQLAWILLAREQSEEALRLIGDVIADSRAQLEEMATRRAPRELQALVTHGEADLAAALSIVRLAHGDPDPQLTTRIFELVEAARSVAATQRRLVATLERVDASAELSGALEELSQARAAVVRATREGGLFDALRRRDRAERALHAQLLRDPEVARELPQVSFEAIRAALAPSEAALSFWRHERWSLRSDARHIEPDGEHYLAFVVRPDAPLRRFELGPADAIDAAVEAWREALLRGVPRGASPIGDPADEELEAGRRLRRLVLDPLRAALEDVELFRVALDDALHVVPLDALPEDDADAGVVGDRARFVACTSLKELTRRAAPTGPPALLALGGIDYDGSPAAPPSALRSTAPRAAAWQPSFNYLPATDSEVRTLAHYFERAHPGRPLRLLTADEATRAAFEAEASSASFLHLATHAYFAPESVPSMLDARGGSELPSLDPRAQARGLAPLLLCGLAFAGANQRGPAGAAGRMTAEELSGLDLARCELAVLSACETGIGVRRAGQGVASLQSALHAAGARSMITSLWKVPDQASRELMGHFYRALWVEGRTKAEALWAAKVRLRLEVRPDGRARFATSDWAGWILSGAPD